MLTDLILGIFIFSDILLFMFCIAICFFKSPHWIEMEYTVRVMSGLITAMLSYRISQMLLDSSVTAYGVQTALKDLGMADFFFWFMCLGMILYTFIQIALYILEKVDYATRQAKQTVRQMAKHDLEEGLIDARRD